MKIFHRGFSLLEVLVAVLVVGLGLLGMVSLHVTTHLYNQSSLHRGQSAMLAREIVERMRVNVDEAKAGSYEFDTATSTIPVTNCLVGPGNLSADCSASQMTEHDLRVWSERVAAMLPGGSGVIATTIPVDPADPVGVTVTLGWTGRRSAGMLSDAPTQKSQAFQFEIYGTGG